MSDIKKPHNTSNLQTVEGAKNETGKSENIKNLLSSAIPSFSFEVMTQLRAQIKQYSEYLETITIDKEMMDNVVEKNKSLREEKAKLIDEYNTLLSEYQELEQYMITIQQVAAEMEKEEGNEEDINTESILDEKNSLSSLDIDKTISESSDNIMSSNKQNDSIKENIKEENQRDQSYLNELENDKHILNQSISKTLSVFKEVPNSSDHSGSESVPIELSSLDTTSSPLKSSIDVHSMNNEMIMNDIYDKDKNQLKNQTKDTSLSSTVHISDSISTTINIHDTDIINNKTIENNSETITENKSNQDNKDNDENKDISTIIDTQTSENINTSSSSSRRTPVTNDHSAIGNEIITNDVNNNNTNDINNNNTNDINNNTNDDNNNNNTNDVNNNTNNNNNNNTITNNVNNNNTTTTLPISTEPSDSLSIHSSFPIPEPRILKSIYLTQSQLELMKSQNQELEINISSLKHSINLLKSNIQTGIEKNQIMESVLKERQNRKEALISTSNNIIKEAKVALKKYKKQQKSLEDRYSKVRHSLFCWKKGYRLLIYIGCFFMGTLCCSFFRSHFNDVVIIDTNQIDIETTSFKNDHF
ncbi:hypothetical protein WA158_001371 [Blastocystis sp. Blastoise]